MGNDQELTYEKIFKFLNAFKIGTESALELNEFAN